MTTLLSKPFFFIKTLVVHLWMSISSVKFYERVFISYNGYGMQYAFSLSILSSLMCSVLFLNHTFKVRDYLDNNVMSQNVLNIDHVIRQLPIIDYDGQKISINEETPLFIYNLNNYKLLAFDPDRKLMPSDRIKIPIVLGDSTIIISLLDSDNKVRNTLPIKYSQIFGNHPQLLTQEIIKSSFANIFEKAPSLLIYLVFPIVAILIFINALLEKSFIILIIYLISRFSNIKAPLKTCIRVVLFASGFFILLQFIVTLTAQSFSTALWVLQTWSNLLMIVGILKASGKSRFLSL